MRFALAVAFALMLGACAQQGAPRPLAALPVCQAAAASCGAAPYCYRTLGRVDCYATAELARATVEEIVPPAACLAPRIARAD